MLSQAPCFRQLLQAMKSQYLLWGFPACLVAQKRLWAGYHGVGIASQAIAGPASTEESTAATLIILNFVIRTSSWFWKRESLSLAATAGSTLSF